MKYDIFISYKRKDKEKVFAFKDYIEKKVGARCWIDLDGIESDAQFASVIIKAINDAQVFLFMYSRSHAELVDLDTDWTIREINYAQKRKKRIVFVNIDATPLTDWFELMFGTKQQVDATSVIAKEKLCKDLIQWLKINNESSYCSTSKAVAVIKEYEGDADSDYESAYTAWKNKEYGKAFPVFLRLAQCGYERAYGYVGLCYELGEGVAKDYQQMLVYYNKAIEAKDYIGVYRLGIFYTSRGDFGKARQLYEQAIQEGWATGDAYLKIATMYEEGQGGIIDLGKAIQYYRIALQHHEVEAQSALNRLGVYDEVVLPESFLKYSARQLYKLGEQNCKGFGSNESLAFALFKAAAAKGHPFAAKRVVQMYSDNGFPFEDEGVIRDYKQLATDEMIIWTQRDSDFAWEAGYAYHYGVGCFASIEKAEECFRIGVEHGSASCQWELGRIEEAKGSFTDAYNHYRKAAESGQGMAMFELARCYETGIGTPKDLQKAIRWYEECSQSRYASASEAKEKLRKLKSMIK
jgi:TPR repeat protein